MQKFVYKAYDSSFNIVKGEIEEQELEIAKQKLKIKGLTIIDIKVKIQFENLNIFKRKIKDEDIASFCGQIATIINAGLNIVKGLEIIKSQNKKLKSQTDSILKFIQGGETLGNAMEKTGEFPKLLTDMIKSGDLSGNVDTILFNMEQYYERESALKNKIKNASIYPSIILSVAIIMMLFFNYFIFGKMGEIYTNNDNLPGITKLLLIIMHMINNNIIKIIILIILIVFILQYIKKFNKIKYIIDTAILKIPLIGVLNIDIITDRFARSLFIFLKSAVPIFIAFESIETIIGNKYIAKKMGVVKNDIVSGSGIADALEKEKIFDPLVIEMMRIGEETGKLEEMLNRLYSIYDKKVERGISKAMALIEPMFTLIIGFIVGFVVIGMALPILQISNTIK